jgi:anion-transporting  ArsA/GET3 family ATPase
MSQYGAMVLNSRRVYSRLFENRYVKNFLDAVPGLNEWAVLGETWYFTTLKLSEGRPRFDTVLLDAPATGHALDMLKVPKIIVEVAPTGVLRRDAQRAWQMLQDPEQSGVVLVTLAEELPASETLELSSELENQLGLPILGLVINQVVPNLFSEKERKVLLDARASISESGAWLTLADVATRRALREQLQAELLRRLGAVPGPQWRLPLSADSAEEGRLIASLAKVLAGEVRRESDAPVLRAER